MYEIDCNLWTESLTFILSLVGAFLDENVQLQFVWNIPLDLDPDAEANQCGQAAMRHCGVELYPDHIHVV